DFHTRGEVGRDGAPRPVAGRENDRRLPERTAAEHRGATEPGRKRRGQRTGRTEARGSSARRSHDRAIHDRGETDRGQRTAPPATMRVSLAEGRTDRTTPGLRNESQRNRGRPSRDLIVGARPLVLAELPGRG